MRVLMALLRRPLFSNCAFFSPLKAVASFLNSMRRTFGSSVAQRRFAFPS
jgi:hypothetical protein